VNAVSDDAAGGLAHSVLAGMKYLFYVQGLSITLGLFLLLTDVIKEKHDHSVIGVRLIFFGFAWEFWQTSSFGRADLGKRFWAVIFLAMSVARLRYLLAIYQYLK
jgi:hypothetical protein